MVGIIVMTVTSLILGLILALVDQYINKDIKEVKDIEIMLPGYNCNSCGMGSCRGMAEHAIIDSNNLKRCRFLKKEQLQEIITYINNKKDIQ